MITRLIGRRRDETAASFLSTAARDGTSKLARAFSLSLPLPFSRSLCLSSSRVLFLFIRTAAVPCAAVAAAAAVGRDCNRNIAEYAGEAIRGERKRNIPSTAEPVYNFISRRPGAPRRDRRHAHLCVSWAPAQVASPFSLFHRSSSWCFCYCSRYCSRYCSCQRGPSFVSFLLLRLPLPLLSPPVAGLFAPDKSSEEWPLEIHRSLFLQCVTKTVGECKDEC